MSAALYSGELMKASIVPAVGLLTLVSTKVDSCKWNTVHEGLDSD